MVPKLKNLWSRTKTRFRAVLFRMVPKHASGRMDYNPVLELCCFEWFQNQECKRDISYPVLELCCFEWFQNTTVDLKSARLF